MAAMSSLSMRQNLLDRVIPRDQGFSANEGYCGAFRFNFWVFGKWEEVIVDDRLPTDDKGLVFTSSQDENEFWAALLEKAYAKYEFTNLQYYKSVVHLSLALRFFKLNIGYSFIEMNLVIHYVSSLN